MDTDPKQKRFGGRPKGSQNKIAKAAKEVIEQASHELGGAERIVAWAKEDPLNERAFWASIYPKLLPLQVAGSGAAGQLIVEVVRFSQEDGK
jgi:hypothetical protein